MNKFISFEGIDGSGKTTQIELLIDKLKSANKKAISFREPGGTPISESIREILLNNKNSTLSDTSESLLFFASRSQLLSEKIIPLTKDGYFVICDRFNDSTIAYQGYGKNIDVNYSPTALIPVVFGVIILVLNSGLKKENKLIAHVVVLLTFLILFGLVKPLMSAIEGDRIMGITRVSLMMLSTLMALVVFIKSFIANRSKKS